MNTLNTFLLVVFPYVAGIVFLVGVIYRYRQTGFTVSSLSSQFLEGDKLFWGAVPFHIGLLAVFFGHLLAFLLPQATLAWNSVPVRLIILEVSAFVFGLSLLFGLLSLLWRRLTNPRVRVVTSRMDIVIELLLLAQVVLGCWVALGFRWGSSWFAADLTPYLWSLLGTQPRDRCGVRPALGDQAAHRGRVLDPLHGAVHAPRSFHRRAPALHRAALSGGHVELGSQGRSRSARAVEQSTPEEQLAMNNRG